MLARWILSKPPHPVSQRYILMSSCLFLGLPNSFFPAGFSNKCCTLISADTWKCLDQLFIELITQIMVEECKSWLPHYADWPSSSAILRRSGAVLLLPLLPSWHGQGWLQPFMSLMQYFFFYFCCLLPCKSSYLSQYSVKTC